jgi:hypothetical protein
MAHALHNFQLDQLLGNQAQIPAFVSFWGLLAHQSHQMRFLLPVPLALLGSLWL